MWFHVTVYLLETAGSGHFCVILYGSVYHCFWPSHKLSFTDSHTRIWSELSFQ